MKIYGITVHGRLFEGEEIKTTNGFLRTISTERDEIVIPSSFKVYKTAEERNISIFLDKKSHLSINEVSVRYNISKEEAQTAYDKAFEMFPEKFI